MKACVEPRTNATLSASLNSAMHPSLNPPPNPSPNSSKHTAQRTAPWLRHALLGAAFAVLGGCAHKPPPLYAWEGFPKLQYDSLRGAGAAPLDQVAPMEAQAEQARAAGAALPPGFRAHLGMLKLAEGDPARARELWQAEKLAFPESSAYMNQLLKRLDAPAKKENPA